MIEEASTPSQEVQQSSKSTKRRKKKKSVEEGGTSNTVPKNKNSKKKKKKKKKTHVQITDITTGLEPVSEEKHVKVLLKTLAKTASPPVKTSQPSAPRRLFNPYHSSKLRSLSRMAQHKSWLKRSRDVLKEYELAENRKLLGQTSFNCITLDNPVRKFCCSALESNYFEELILLFIIASSILLGYSNSEEGTVAYDICFYGEYVFLFVFSLEMVIKLIAWGAWSNGKLSYFRNLWNILDFIVVVAGFLSLVPSLSELTSIRAIRVFRILKMAKANEGLQMLMESIMSSFPGLGDVLLVASFFLFLFGIALMQVAGGTYEKTQIHP